MRKAETVYGDKEFITQVNRKYVFFNFNGSQDRLPARLHDLKEFFEWLKEEIVFYERMRYELHESYEKQKEEFDSTRHFYSDEEITEACKRDRFASIDMGIRNKYYLEDWHKIVGIGNESSRVLDKLEKLRKLLAQTKAAINELEK